jgi:DNA primase
MIWRKALDGRELGSPERRAGLDQDLRATLRRIEDPSVRAHYAQAIRDRRDALFASAPRPGRDPRGGARSGWRGPAGARRGFGPGARLAFGFAEAPSAELRATPLVAQSEAADVRIREAAILWGALHHPQVAERHEDRLRAARFINRDLGTLLDALLDALPDCLDAPDPRAALRARLEDALGFDAEPFLRSDRLALTRGLGPEAPRAQVEVAFDEVLERHLLFLSAAEEQQAARDEISIETADEIAARLAYISRRRDEAAPRDSAGRRDAEAGAEDGEGGLEEKLRAFVAGEPWVKRPRRKN